MECEEFAKDALETGRFAVSFADLLDEFGTIHWELWNCNRFRLKLVDTL
jgi:hypothetical protein